MSESKTSPLFSSVQLLPSHKEVNLKAVVSVKYNINGVLLACASADKKIHVFNTSSTGGHAVILDGEHSRGISDCAWLSEKLLLSCSDDQTIKVWDIEANKVICSFRGTDCNPYSIAINHRNKMIVSGRVIDILCGNYCNCKLLAASMAGGSDGRLLFFHLSSKEPIMSFDAHSETVASIDCHPNGRELLSGGHDGLTRVWDSAYTSCCMKTVVCDNDQQLTPISCVQYSPNGEYILLSSLKSLHRLYDRSSFVGLGSYHGSSNADIPDTSNTSNGRCWAPSSKFNPLPLRSYSGHENSKYSIHSCFYRFGNNHNYVMSGSECGQVYLWDLNTTAVAAQVKAHEGAVLSVASHPDPTSSQFASASLDGSVNIFEITSNE